MLAIPAQAFAAGHLVMHAKSPAVGYRPTLDTLLFTLLAGGFIANRFTIELPQAIPGSHALTAVLLFSLGLYWWLDLQASRRPEALGRIRLWKWSLILWAIALIVFASTLLGVWWRRTSAPYQYVHDGLIQSEAATSFVLQGQNPYYESFADTPMAQWPFREGDLSANPALDHYPYMPLTFLLPLPLQAILEPAMGWFDQRLLYLALFALLLILTVPLTGPTADRLLLLAALGLNPAFVPYLVEGRNDILPLVFLALCILLVQRGHRNGSAAALGAACATKQLAWFFVPLFFLYLSGLGPLPDRLRRLKGPLWSFGGVFALLVVPWVIWDAGAFLEDTLAFQSGLLPGGYPVKGFGFSVILLSAGLIESNLARFPFWVLQLAIGMPVLVLAGRQQWRAPELRAALAAYALLTFVVMFFSRAFNDNYFGYLGAVLALSAWIEDPSPGQTEGWAG